MKKVSTRASTRALANAEAQNASQTRQARVRLEANEAVQIVGTIQAKRTQKNSAKAKITNTEVSRQARELTKAGLKEADVNKPSKLQ